MADFHQNGQITSLHNLVDRPIEELEAELVRFSRKRPISLVLPSLFSELEGPALGKIVDEISKVEYISEVVIGLDRANEEQFQFAKKYFSRLPQDHRILWNDGPRLKAIDSKLKELGLAPSELGKGRNVWYCFGYVLASGKAESVGLHDCDILTYNRGMLARLMYPVVHPNFGYSFAKGFYARIADGSMGGRVCRLLVSPFLKAITRTIGHNDYLDFLSAFKYPLAGEFSMRMGVIRDIRIPSDWGLEIGVLSELHRAFPNRMLCQVDIADNYDHKHQELSPDDAAKGLSKMSADVSKAIFRKLATNGHTFSESTVRTIKATYYRMALDFVDMYYKDAQINGLKFDRHKEEAAVELFAQNIVRAGESFLSTAQETPFMPSWNRVSSALPGILDEIKTAVNADN